MSLSLKLYISIFLVMFIGLTIFTVINITNQKASLIRLVQQNAFQTTDLIKNSIHYSMLINRKGDIDQIFQNFEKMQGFEVIRIYDKCGRIMYSTKLEEKYSEVPISSTECQVCHSASEPLKDLGSKERLRITTTESGRRILSLINPIVNEPSCSGSDCHQSSDEKFILGILDVQMSLDAVDADIAHSQRNIVIASAVLVITVLMVVGYLIWTQIRKPVLILNEGTKAIAKGNLEYSISVSRIGGGDELGKLAGSFNLMVSRLRKAREEVTEWSNTLQQKVEEKTEELEHIQSQLIQIEKMASLGKLAATVAHELNNPLAGILTYTRLTLKRLEDKKTSPETLSEIQTDLKMVSEETMRCGNIVRNLLLFSKRHMGEFAYENLQTILSHCLQLIQHHLALNNITLKRLHPDDEVEAMCDKDQMHQAILAILVNAVEAMPDGGTLTVGLTLEEDHIFIRIKDSGEGVAAEQLPHIFEPFYSDKKDGNGVGLGLSVAYGIIKRHEGRIEVESLAGQGATFIFVLPRRLEKGHRDHTTVPEITKLKE